MLKEIMEAHAHSLDGLSNIYGLERKKKKRKWLLIGRKAKYEEKKKRGPPNELVHQQITHLTECRDSLALFRVTL